MKKGKLVLGLLFLGFLGACNSQTSETSEELAHADYACSMECEGDKTYDEPGQCPVCKMDLSEIGADED